MARAMLTLCLLAFCVAVSLLIGGCATFNAPVNPEYRRASVNVTWIETDQVPAVCRNDRALACALPSDPCIIYTYPEPAFDTLGHELLHCFMGRWH